MFALQLPQMHPFPGENSVIVLDNAIVHHSEELAAACAVLVLC
jgi:hypothetical protein